MWGFLGTSSATGLTPLMDANALFEQAVQTALKEREVVQQLAALEALGDPRKELEAAVMDARDEVMEAAEAELTRWEQLAREFAAQTVDAATDQDPLVDPRAAERLKPLIARIEELQAEQDEAIRTERTERDRLEDMRIAIDVLRSRQAGKTELAKPPSRIKKLRSRLHALRPESSEIDRRLDEYLRGLEKLQIDKRRIADIVTAKKRLQIQQEKLEQDTVKRSTQEVRRREVLRARLEAARVTAYRALVERGVLPICRRWLNDRLENLVDRYRNDLQAAVAQGLAELPNPTHEVPTTASRRLTRLLAQMPGGAIGISGARGSGKTTLVKSFCRGDRPLGETLPRLTVFVPAPVKFVALEFVLYVLEKACRAALPRSTRIGPLERPSDERSVHAARVARTATVVAMAAGTALVAVGLVLAVVSIAASGLSDDRERLLMVGALAAAATVAVLRAVVPAVRAAVVAICVSFSAAVVVSVTTGSWDGVEWAMVAVTGLLAGGVSHLWLALQIPRRVTHRSVWLASGGCTVAAALALALLDAGHRAVHVGPLLLLAVSLVAPVVVGVCERALHNVSDGDTARRVPAGVTALVVATAYEAMLTVGAVLSVLALALITLAIADRPLPGLLAAGIGGCAVGGVLVGLGMRARRLASREIIGESTDDGKLAGLEVLARDELQRIKYQQTFTSGWTGKLGVPGALQLPVEASVTAGRSSAEQALMLPAILDRLRDFLAAAVSEGPVVVGIDELDKIASQDDADVFLNEIKAMFGIPGCYFLISVSEDAVASFERRGMPFRDVLDSTFDDILRVDHLKLAGAEAMLRERTLQTPLPFIGLCHCLSGGLARDLIRIARRLFDLREADQSSSIGTLTPALVAAELRAKRDGTVTAAGHLAIHAKAGEALRWLASAEPEPSTTALTARLQSLPILDDDSVEPASLAVGRLVREYAAYWYFGATLAEFFTDERSAADYERAERSNGTDALEYLAAARQGFAIDPMLAWDRVSEFRLAWKLERVDIENREPQP